MSISVGHNSMTASTNLSKLIRSFYNREIDRFSLYVEGFGGFFISRTKDGMVMGFIDKKLLLGTDDHFTVFLDKSGLKGLHRKVTDIETDVYIRYNVDYIQSPEGVRHLIQDMRERRDVSMAVKLLLAFLYKVLDWVSKGTHYRSAEVLQDLEARKVGMKSPCIYVKLKHIDRVFFSVYGKMLQLQNRLQRLRYGKRTSKVFTEHKLPASQTSKRPKRMKM